MMKRKHQDFKLVPFPKMRRVLSVMLHSVQRKHMMHAYRKGKNQLILFEDVDMTVQIERKVVGQMKPAPSIHSTMSS